MPPRWRDVARALWLSAILWQGLSNSALAQSLTRDHTEPQVDAAFYVRIGEAF
jgi:hypothetical protein